MSQAAPRPAEANEEVERDLVDRAPGARVLAQAQRPVDGRRGEHGARLLGDHHRGDFGRVRKLPRVFDANFTSASVDPGVVALVRRDVGLVADHRPAVAERSETVALLQVGPGEHPMIGLAEPRNARCRR